MDEVHHCRVAVRAIQLPNCSIAEIKASAFRHNFPAPKRMSACLGNTSTARRLKAKGSISDYSSMYDDQKKGRRMTAGPVKS